MAAPDTGRSWLVGICSVLFDIDVGPRVSNLIPGDQVLTPEERQDIAFYAFPVSAHTVALHGWLCSVLQTAPCRVTASPCRHNGAMHLTVCRPTGSAHVLNREWHP